MRVSRPVAGVPATGRRQCAGPFESYAPLGESLLRALYVERGARHWPYPDTVQRLADSLHLDGSERAALVAAARRLGRAAATARQSRGPGRRLPVPPTRLVGREAELADLHARLFDGDTRLLTLTGAGGSGKTRLALQLANEVRDAFRDGVWLVELASLAEAMLVPQAVASVFQIEALPGRPLLDQVVGVLRQRALLVVLDNCEHLIEACARLSERLLSECPRVRILATSRELLRVPGEVVWRVPPLRVPEVVPLPPTTELAQVPAVRLFVARVQAVRADFLLEDANAATVAQVCARLEGLPLALELAAARTRVLSVEQVLAHLHDMFRLLASGSRTAPSRQQTVRATLDWSHALLSPPEQVVFRRLAIFAGGCDLAAAEAVCAVRPKQGTAGGLAAADVLDLLMQLVDKSLVEVEQQGAEAWYRLLEPVRQYALLHLEASGEHELLTEQHAETYLRRAETALESPGRVAWQVEFTRLGRDLDNLRAALGWSRASPERLECGLQLAGALWRFWLSSGRTGEGRRWLSELLTRPAPRGPTVGRAKALFAAGVLAAQQEGLEAARGLAAECLVLCEQLGDPRWLGMARFLDGLVCRVRDPATAVQRAQESLAAAIATGDATLHYFALFLLGEARRVQGDLDGAIRLLEECRSSLMGHADPVTTGYYLRSLAQVAMQRGDYGQATELLRERLTRMQQLGDQWTVPDAVEGLAWVATAQGHWQRAAHLYGAAAGLRDVGGSTMLGERQARRERRLGVLRQELGAAGFAAAWAAGRALSSEQVVSLALADADRCGGRPSGPRPRTEPLTPRERDVAALLAQGRTNRQIGEALVISERTATVHVQHILAKLDLHSRWQVADWLAAHAAHPSSAQGAEGGGRRSPTKDT